MSELCIDVLQIIFAYVDDYITWSKMKTLEQIFGLRFWSKNLLIKKMILSFSDLVKRNDLPNRLTHLVIKNSSKVKRQQQESIADWLPADLVYLKLPNNFYQSKPYFCQMLWTKTLACKLDFGYDRDIDSYLNMRVAEHFIRSSDNYQSPNEKCRFDDVKKLVVMDDYAMKYIDSQYLPNLTTFVYHGKLGKEFYFIFSTALKSFEVVTQDILIPSVPLIEPQNLVKFKISSPDWSGRGSDKMTGLEHLDCDLLTRDLTIKSANLKTLRVRGSSLSNIFFDVCPENLEVMSVYRSSIHIAHLDFSRAFRKMKILELDDCNSDFPIIDAINHETLKKLRLNLSAIVIRNTPFLQNAEFGKFVNLEKITWGLTVKYYKTLISESTSEHKSNVCCLGIWNSDIILKNIPPQLKILVFDGVINEIGYRDLLDNLSSHIQNIRNSKIQEISICGELIYKKTLTKVILCEF
jgi:hypothetical protein